MITKDCVAECAKMLSISALLVKTAEIWMSYRTLKSDPHTGGPHRLYKIDLSNLACRLQ